MGIIYYGFSLQCSVCHDSARNKKKKSFVDILREKNGWCFLIAAATTSNPLFYICEHLSNPQTQAGPPPLLLLPSVTFFTLLPCHPPLLLLYCTVLNETEESASMILSLETIPWSIHIIKAPNLSWSSFPPLLSFPPSCFLHCCCRQLLYHQSNQSKMTGSFWNLAWGYPTLNKIIGKGSPKHLKLKRARRALQAAEGHQPTAGARKLAGRRPANFSS